MDVLRLAAASLVIVAHSYNLTNNEEPLRRFGGPEFGDIAVAVFFAISGLLVTASWMSDPRPRSFLMRRALRILPGLWVVLLATVAVGLVVTTLRHELPDVARHLALSDRARDRVLDPPRPARRVQLESVRQRGQRLALDAARRGHGLRRDAGVRSTGLLARKRSVVLAAIAALI